MKRITAIILTLTLVITMLTACGGSGGSATGGGDGPVDLGSLKTMGDILKLDTQGSGWSIYENKMVYAFQVEDYYYRVVSSITDEQQQAIMDIDYSDSNYEEEENKIISEFKIDSAECLNDQILSREEMDGFVGKTGQELFDAGWKEGMGYNYETMEFWLNYGPFEYTVVFDGEATEADFETKSVEEILKDFPVKSIEFSTIGDATEL